MSEARTRKLKYLSVADLMASRDQRLRFVWCGQKPLPTCCSGPIAAKPLTIKISSLPQTPRNVGGENSKTKILVCRGFDGVPRSAPKICLVWSKTPSHMLFRSYSGKTSDYKNFEFASNPKKCRRRELENGDTCLSRI